jgi:hypothetical protein
MIYEGEDEKMLKKSKDDIEMTGGFYLSCERVTGGIALLVGGVIGVSELSCDCTELLSHSGRIRVRGRALELATFENRIIEIKGRIEGVDFVYGKT